MGRPPPQGCLGFANYTQGSKGNTPFALTYGMDVLALVKLVVESH